MARRTLFCAVLLAAGAVLQAPLPQVTAQENLLGEFYGLGVHAYNAGDYREAFSNFTAAVEGGSRDPRVYYFRGLALSNLGRSSSAEQDFAMGAQLEAANSEQYAVGRSLERIQGNQRLKIERARKVAKIKFQQEQLAKSKALYEQRRAGVVEPVLPTSDEFATKAPPVDTSKLAASDPFGAGDGLGTGAAEKAPVKPEPGTVAGGGADPFGGSEEPAAGGAEPDPFGGGEAPAAGGGDADPFGGGDEPAAGGGDDPFGGGDEPAAGGGDADPFGGEEPAAEGEAPEAGGGEAPPAGEDPFGGEDGDEAPAGGEAPPAGDDPFGDAEGAAPPIAAPAVGGAGPARLPAGGGAGEGAVGGVIRGIGSAIGGAAAPDNRDPFEDADEPKAGGAAPAVRPIAPPVGGAEGGDPFGDDPVEEPEMENEAAGDPFGG